MTAQPLLNARFWSKVAPQENGCLLWTGARTRTGHGQFGVSRQGGPTRYAHRIAWESIHGPVPEGLELDHLCRQPSCINHEHLEAVTHQENVLRGDGLAAHQARRTHCPKGHPYSEANTWRDKYNKRYCRQCSKDRHATWLGGAGE